MAYSDLAPTCESVGATQAELQAILDAKPAPITQGPVPTITKQHVLNIANMVCSGNSLSEHGGVVVVGQEEGLTSNQVKLIVKELCAVFAAMENNDI